MRGVRGEARALGAERLLRDLDDDLLPFLQELLDFRFFTRVAVLRVLLPPSSSPVSSGRALRRDYDVGDIEKAVTLETEVDKGRLHARQHLRHPSLVDVADDAAVDAPARENFAT